MPIVFGRQRPMPRKGLAIAGAGMVGAYLHRLLRRQGTQADIYDRPARTRCGIQPCAWGTSRGFRELVAAAGLDPEQYLLRQQDHLFMDEVRVAADLMTFHKPRLIQDLLGDVPVRTTPLDPAAYDRVIDATGVARAYLPSAHSDLVMRCVQRLVHTPEDLGNRVKLGGIGYAWCFPLDGENYHLGCGSLSAEPGQVLQTLGWLDSPPAGQTMQTRCRCSSSIRLSGPQGALPFVASLGETWVWGVGEAIGCVAPLAGDGIVTGMKTAQLLLENWNDPRAYTGAVLREFAWMEKERKVLERLRGEGRLRLRDAKVLRDNSRRMGMRLGLREAAVLLRRLL